MRVFLLRIVAAKNSMKRRAACSGIGGPARRASELRSADALAGKGMPVKTDRKDARSIAQLMRLGWFRPCTANRYRRRKYEHY
jgi:hypothetical protein